MKLEEKLRRAIQAAGHALNTEKAYVQNYNRFVQFAKAQYGEYRHPADLAKSDVEDFLTHLAADKQLAPDTQRVALSALKFLYEQVLETELGVLKYKSSTKPKNYLS